MNNHTMELKIWSGESDIPSIHFESLQIWTLIKIARVPVKVQVAGNALWTPKGTLPVLTHEKKQYCSFQEVIDVLSSQNINPDQHLDETVKSDITAYTAMLKEKLYPAIQYTWWLDRKNFEVVTRPSFAKASTWPLNFYYPPHFENKAKELMEALYSSTEDWDLIASEVFAEAQICLNSLSTILGNKKFFFGDELTSFDATLYAYLCPTLRKDFPNKKLESQIKGCANLVKYVDRISEELFPEFCEAPRKSKEEPERQSSSTKTMSKRTHIIISALVALTSITSFAYFAGVVDSGKRAAEEESRTEDEGSDPLIEYLFY